MQIRSKFKRQEYIAKELNNCYQSTNRVFTDPYNRENPDNLPNGEMVKKAVISTIKSPVLKQARKWVLVYMSTRGWVKGIRG